MIVVTTIAVIVAALAGYAIVASLVGGFLIERKGKELTNDETIWLSLAWPVSLTVVALFLGGKQFIRFGRWVWRPRPKLPKATVVDSRRVGRWAWRQRSGQ